MTGERRSEVDPQVSPTQKEAPMRPQPLISVSDVEASSRWYQKLLGCRSAPRGYTI